jgi:hypothetical protein
MNGKVFLMAGFVSTATVAWVATAASDDGWNPLKSGDQTQRRALGPHSRPNSPQPSSAAFTEAVERTAAMAENADYQAMAQRFGLQILNLTWEDTGRYKNSSVGPNISDMTIQVATRDRQGKIDQVRAMPVIRFPNFTDKTGDIDPRQFTLLVGNQNGRSLKRVSLYDFLQEPTLYLTKASSWSGRNKSLLAPERDSKVLVSAQACFLPVPQQGVAQFNPVLFNYQSVKGDPAVLTILATREGTSTTIIDNTRDAFGEGNIWGQRLFHNKNGLRASLTGTRLSDFQAQGNSVPTSESGKTGLSMVLLIQVPLKQRESRRSTALAAPATSDTLSGQGGGGFAKSNVERAVIGHGEVEGPFTEIDNLAIERDPRFPVRVTVQFYKATSNGVVNESDLRAVAREIESVYAEASNVGSLVVDGETGRVTEYAGVKVQPRGWWREFWQRHQRNTGQSPEDARRALVKLLGPNYESRPVSDLYLSDALRKKR